MVAEMEKGKELEDGKGGDKGISSAGNTRLLQILTSSPEGGSQE